MDSITEKIAKVTDLTSYTDLTPEHFKKLFDEIGGSPEKLRSILNLWFVPDFKPTFVEPQNYAFSGLQDIDFLDVPDTEMVQRPLRLIDLETRNLVDRRNTSSLDSYCMLSHRWKGDEITLAHITRAREKHVERVKSRSLLDGEADGDDDIHLVLLQSKQDITEQEKAVLSLLNDSSVCKDVGELLEKRIAANDARYEVNRARQNWDYIKSKAERCRMEKDMFDHLIKRVNQDISDKMEETIGTSQASDANRGSMMSTIVDGVYREYEAAQEKLSIAIETQEGAHEDAAFFHESRQLGDAVDELMSRLQRWKSANKLDQSIKRARNIFKTKLFPKGGACYIWSDTCCIDKLNYGELSQSLSLMGDWYANASFCLVHLDTNWRPSDAVNDWRQFKRKPDMPEAKKLGTPSFNAIKDSNPQWATRAWTLQELVMSKMAFFFNSEWEPLSRPIESLGYIYPLIPFIELYTCGDMADTYSEALYTAEPRRDILRGIRDSETIGSLLDKNEVKIAGSDDGSQAASDSVRVALRLASILQGLGLRFPVDMTTETAVSEMSQSVYLGAWNLVRDKNDDTKGRGRKLLQELRENHLPAKARTEDLTPEAEAQHVINFLLVSLVLEAKDLVVFDRAYIAKFGQVNQLDSWKQGTVRSGFPAERVLHLSCRREATEPVDHVYSLMGILGVRFQSFHAEGYPKALSRLLDEVIITHNDVSVFNWAGVEMGSPVRGRSMYPASHKAYGNDEDRGRRYNMLISAQVQKKRKEVMNTYQGVITILRDTIDCIKTKGRNGLPLEWIREISAFIRNSSFDKLQPELKNIGKILLYIKDHCIQPVLSPIPDEKPSRVETTTNAVSDAKTGWSLKKPSLPGKNISASLKTPKLSSFGVGGISKPSFGRHHSEPVEKSFAEEPTSSGQVKPTTPEAPKWMSLDHQVKQYLKSLGPPDWSNVEECALPSQIQELDFKAFEPESTTGNGEDHSSKSALRDLICPNPIIVNSSGIEGIFDIQRIVVTMIDRERLLRQVAKAASPKQKISGWCTISTGFASVAVNFACEQHMLRRQLEVEQAVKDKIIKEDRGSKVHGDLEIQGATKTKGEDGRAAKEDRPSDPDKADEKGDVSSKPTKEEQAIVRVIDFIQEPQLQLVAGEWVLARFSGARGAKWFLCYLELGSTHQFYGHRIATSDIDFANSAIEPGLVNAWQIYMGRKKRKMCNILTTYIKSSESAAKGQERLSKTSEIVNHNYGRLVDAGSQSLERVVSMRTLPSSIPKLPFSESTNNGKNSVDSDSENDESSGNGIFDDVLDQGKEAAMALGEYTVLAAYEKLCELHAKHLDKHLATSVLKKTPKALQTAVESVDENKGFLPAMFHSSRRVHMF